MEIIVPAAGLSTRFPNTRPKYLLYDYKHTLMFRNAVEPYYRKAHKIHVGILREHADKYDAREHILGSMPNANVITIEERTKGPAHTVYEILKVATKDFSFDISFLVKDCDSFFTHEHMEGNFICVSKIDQHETLNRLASKSFVRYNDQGIVTDIVEKNVVSDTFCVGGYAFASSDAFAASYMKLSRNATSEIYVSHIIQDMILNSATFSLCPVSDYVDVGTAEDWHKYNNKPVIFCDIDGTLVKAQSRFGKYNYNSDPIVLEENYKLIKQHHDNGSQVIFVTAREPFYRPETIKMLTKLGFKNVQIIMGVNNSSRVVINDYNDANPYPRAIAVNIRRDNDNIKDYMQ